MMMMMDSNISIFDSCAGFGILVCLFLTSLFGVLPKGQ